MQLAGRSSPDPSQAEALQHHCGANRSNSAHTSAMRPEITMRPAYWAFWRPSTIRTTRKGVGRAVEARRAPVGAMATDAAPAVEPTCPRGTSRNGGTGAAGAAAERCAGWRSHARRDIQEDKGAKIPACAIAANPMRNSRSKRVQERQDLQEVQSPGPPVLGNRARRTPATWRCRKRYMSIVLRIRPTARPSISNGSSGWTKIGSKSGFSACSSTPLSVR